MKYVYISFFGFCLFIFASVCSQEYQKSSTVPEKTGSIFTPTPVPVVQPVPPRSYEYRIITEPNAHLVIKVCNKGTRFAADIYSYYFPWQSPNGEGSYGLIDNRLNWYKGETVWQDIDHLTDVEKNPWLHQLKDELIQLVKEGRCSGEGEIYP